MSDVRMHAFTVYIVDDDVAIRDSLSLLLGLLGYPTATFESAEAFLRTRRADWTGCVVADLRLPGKSGLDLQADLVSAGSRLPFIVITGHGDVPSARRAFQADAVDFLEKPFDEADLRDAIERARKRESSRIAGAAAEAEVADRLGRLTPREREVLALVGMGRHAKEIAWSLGISPRTVEVHKARLMAKLDARNVSELVRFAVAVEPRPATRVPPTPR